jgi:hypothetical protein
MLAIPLGPRRLVGSALDLLTRPDSGLRSASFYIGLLMLVTVAPAAALFGLAATTGAINASGADVWQLWFLLALVPAFLGLIAASVEARALAVAVIGGRAEGRPLRLRESIAVARARFWPVLGAQLLVIVLTTGVQFVISYALVTWSGGLGVFDYAISVAVGVVVGTAFIYTPAGIVLGEVDMIEAIRRSIRLARARKTLAVAVTVFSVLSGLVIQFGIGLAFDTASRVLSGVGVSDTFPPVLVVPLVAALVFAYGTLVLLTEAIAAAPAVHAFLALTHYAGGLERGRHEPARIRHVWDPWFTPGLAAGAALGLTCLVAGLLTMSWG